MTNIQILLIKGFRKIDVLFNKLRESYWDSYDKTIPKYVLSEKHIRNLKPVLDREHLLNELPKHGIVAEIGVDRGEFSKKILSITKPRKLHLIDLWDSKRYQPGNKIVEKKFRDQIIKGIVEINIGLSTNVANNFKNNFFDWIYIDTDHSYQITLMELIKYSKNVKKSGIIAGHDFIIGNWNAGNKYGVINAVYEFCAKYNWEMIYLTMDYSESISFAIRRILSSRI